MRAPGTLQSRCRSLPGQAWAAASLAVDFGVTTSIRLTQYYDQVAVAAYASSDNFDRLDRVEAMAAEKGVSTTQLVLAYAMHAPFDLYALVGCRTPAEFEDNIAALSIELTPRECAWLAGGD